MLIPVIQLLREYGQGFQEKINAFRDETSIPSKTNPRKETENYTQEMKVMTESIRSPLENYILKPRDRNSFHILSQGSILISFNQ